MFSAHSPLFALAWLRSDRDQAVTVYAQWAEKAIQMIHCTDTNLISTHASRLRRCCSAGSCFGGNSRGWIPAGDCNKTVSTCATLSSVGHSASSFSILAAQCQPPCIPPPLPVKAASQRHGSVGNLRPYGQGPSSTGVCTAPRCGHCLSSYLPHKFARMQHRLGMSGRRMLLLLTQVTK